MANAVESEPLFSARCTAHEGHATGGDAQGVGKRPSHRIVRLSVGGGGGDPDLHGPFLDFDLVA